MSSIGDVAGECLLSSTEAAVILSEVASESELIVGGVCSSTVVSYGRTALVGAEYILRGVPWHPDVCIVMSAVTPAVHVDLP